MAVRKKTISAQSRKMSISAPSTKIYDKDFYRWTRTQVSVLKKKEFSKLDIEHLIEEIESLGRSEKRTLESYLSNILLHLLKIKFQPEKRINSWDNSIKTYTHHVEKLLKENPSLRKFAENILEDAYYTARLNASSETGLNEKVFPALSP